MEPKRIFLIAAAFLAAALCTVSFPGEVKPSDVEIDPAAGRALIRQGGRSLFLYCLKNGLFKPYGKELRTPSGLNVLLDSPEDHKHHHGLMFALGVNETDFWGEEGDAVGLQVSHIPLPLRPRQEEVQKCTGFTHGVFWRDSQNTALLNESRTLRFLVLQELPATLVTWQTFLSLPENQKAVKLWGHHYFGLGLRFVREMDGKGTFVHPEGSPGEIFRGDEQLTRGRWCAYRSSVEGKPVTVALFDHPLNPRHPATFFTMSKPFAYLSATMNLHRQPRSLLERESLELRYGIALWDGHADAHVVEEAYRKWLSLEDPLRNHVNVALAEHGTKASASSEYGPDYCAGKAIDGRYLVRETDKWNSKVHITPHYLRLDLGKPRRMEAVVIRHEGVLATLDGYRYNSADFRIQRSFKPWGPWIDMVKPIRGNTDNVTVHKFEPVAARYVRLLIETGEPNGGNAYGRIAELEVYEPKEPLPGKDRDPVPGEEKNRLPPSAAGKSE